MPMKYAEMDWGTMEAVVDKLGGMNGVKRFLRGELSVSFNPRESTVWKTVKLGTQKTPNKYRNALKKVGRCVDDGSDDILGRISCSKQETEVDLVMASVSELGFKGGAYYLDIYIRAAELGLEFCPEEVGPALRLQYGDQPRGERLHIAMEPITDSADLRRIFVVRNDDDELWLLSYGGYPESFWRAACYFVFVRPKS